jgi:cytochrome c
MNQKWILLVAVLALVACQSKKPQAVVAAPAPEVVVLSPAPVALVEPAPVVVAPVAAVEVPVPVVASTPAVVAVPTPAVAPVVAAKPVAVAVPVVVVAKPVVVVAKPVVVVAKPVVVAPKPVAPTAAVVVANTVDALAIAKKRNCLACHSVDKKVVGPAWKDVSAKNRGDAGAQARLEAKIAKGGSGAWGSIPMPPQPQVTAEERTQLARFILNLK